MTQPKGLRLREEEWQALAIKWSGLSDADRDDYREQMTRPQQRRFVKRLEAERDDKTKFAGKMVTRKDAMQQDVLFFNRVVEPILEDIDRRLAALEYRALPMHRRAWLTLAVWWARIEDWLDTKGIRLVKLETDDGEAEDHDAGGARGDEGLGADEPAGQDDGQAAPHRVYGRVDGQGRDPDDRAPGTYAGPGADRRSAIAGTIPRAEEEGQEGHAAEAQACVEEVLSAQEEGASQEEGPEDEGEEVTWL